MDVDKDVDDAAATAAASIAPKPILKLSADVVNRIAAAEVG